MSNSPENDFNAVETATKQVEGKSFDQFDAKAQKLVDAVKNNSDLMKRVLNEMIMSPQEKQNRSAFLDKAANGKLSKTELKALPNIVIPILNAINDVRSYSGDGAYGTRGFNNATGDAITEAKYNTQNIQKILKIKGLIS